MDFRINYELDPIFEVLGLLSISHMDDWRKEAIGQLDEYGIDGETFFRKHYSVVEKYVETFQKYKVTLPQESLFFGNSSFGEADNNLLLLLLAVATENREYLEKPEEIDPMYLRSFLAFYIADTVEHAELPDISDMPQLPDERTMIEFLNRTDVKNEEKWYVLELLRGTGQWFVQLMEMIRKNIPAFEKAKDDVKKSLDKLLPNTGGGNRFAQIAGLLGGQEEIHVTLAYPLLQVVFYTSTYRGVLFRFLEEQETESSTMREIAVRQSKAFSDKSKMDILCMLKSSSKYNLELAEALELSPSTTSHHMNVLLECGFVAVEKRDGKVYYCLSQENVREYIGRLERLLLR